MSDAAIEPRARTDTSVQPVMALDNVVRAFREGDSRLDVLCGASAHVHPGEIVALVGPSGSGKTTLLQIAGLLDHADSGEVWIGGAAFGAMTEAERTRTRRDTLGFVYQFHYLLPEFSALENVVLPQRIAGRSVDEARDHARGLLERLGVGGRLNHRPGELSGGERQRVSIARAVANGPGLLLGDEPTGNLDQRTADHVFGALLELVREHRVAALIATHNTGLAGRMDRILSLQDGVLIDQ